MKVDFHSLLIWGLFSGLMLLKIQTAHQRRTCPSHRYGGSVSISRKCLQQLVWALFVDTHTLHFHLFQKSLALDLQKFSFVVFEYCIYLPWTWKCFSFSVALFSRPLFPDETQAWPVSNVRIQVA